MLHFIIKPVQEITPEETEACRIATSPLPFNGFQLPHFFYVELAKLIDGTVVGYNVYAFKIIDENPFNEKPLPYFFYLRSFVHPAYRDKDVFRKLFTESIYHHLGKDAFQAPFIIAALTINPKVLRFMDTFFQSYPSPKHEVTPAIANFVQQRLYKNMELVNPDYLEVCVTNAFTDEISYTAWQNVYLTQANYMRFVQPNIFVIEGENVKINPQRIFAVAYWECKLDKTKFLLRQ
jgi:GNAT superfamily N-acetyltransferase